MKVIGIDLAGLEVNPSGFAILVGKKITAKTLHTDGEILEHCTIIRPTVIAIDAPLSLPRRGNLREADLSLIKRGFRVFPPKFGGMKSLTTRGIRLARKIRKNKIDVIEVHPRTSGLIISGTDDRKKWMEELKQRGYEFNGGTSRHEIDAALAALTGSLYLKNKTEKIGTPQEGIIIIPRK
ncbi:MAG: DUF429 domain-containing protein [Hadesarchaea archaeon]|nr:DUF429 domain-containing protein [Hadesarchaea archaeon]